MPDRNPYGEPLPTTPVVRDIDRGPDPRRIVADTLMMVGLWERVDYSRIAEDVVGMHPDADSCAFCNEIECDLGCPLTRWRGQA